MAIKKFLRNCASLPPTSMPCSNSLVPTLPLQPEKFAANASNSYTLTVRDEPPLPARGQGAMAKPAEKDVTAALRLSRT
jgi:hypothetical protein